MKQFWELSVRPYVLRAWLNWCCDKNFSCYIVVKLDANCVAPKGYADDGGNLTLNITPGAINDLNIDSSVSFKARFSGQEQQLVFPVGNVVAVYAPETKFEAVMPFAFVASKEVVEAKPSLKVVK